MSSAQLRQPSIVLVVMLLSACDRVYGINRVAEIPALPELNCVEGTIRSIPEIGEVRRWEDRGGRPLTLTGIKAADRLYYFSYGVGETGATLLLSVNYRGQVKYSQHLIRINEKVPQHHIDLVRPIMLKVERGLEERCSVTELTLEITEYCTGVDCTAP